MTVTITPRAQLQRRDVYSGMARIYADGERVYLVAEQLRNGTTVLPLAYVAELALDEDAGAID